MVMTDGPVAPGDKTPLFGGPYKGFTESANPGDTNKDDIVERHLKSFKEQVAAAQEFAPTFINSHSLKVVICVHMDHHSSTKQMHFLIIISTYVLYFRTTLLQRWQPNSLKRLYVGLKTKVF